MGEGVLAVDPDWRDAIMRISHDQYNAGLAAIVAVVLIFGVKALIDGLKSGPGSPGPVAGGYVLPKPDAAAPAAAKEAAPAAAAKAPEAKTADTKPAAEAKPAAAKEAAPAAAAAAFDVAMVAKGDAENGKAIFKKCGACHVADKAAASGVGPNLWGVVGRKKAGREDYASKYSEPMKEKGGEWTYADLATFVQNPAGFVPKTKMTFPGLKDTAAVADLLAFLRTQADSPAALP